MADAYARRLALFRCQRASTAFRYCSSSASASAARFLVQLTFFAFVAALAPTHGLVPRKVPCFCTRSHFRWSRVCLPLSQRHAKNDKETTHAKGNNTLWKLCSVLFFSFRFAGTTFLFVRFGFTPSKETSPVDLLQFRKNLPERWPPHLSSATQIRRRVPCSTWRWKTKQNSSVCVTP